MNVYEAIYARRDVRRFRPDPVADAALWRILDAAHRAPSVGFMQPWGFVVVRDLAIRRRVRAAFERAREREARGFEGARRALYRSLKLEGILESALNLCVTCDRRRGHPVLGRSAMPETDLFSTCLAVENLWLAARAEGLGVGWVSIVSPGELSDILEIPPGVVPVAYLCVGHPLAFPDGPELERAGWRARLPLVELVFRDAYGRRLADGDAP